MIIQCERFTVALLDILLSDWSFTVRESKKCAEKQREWNKLTVEHTAIPAWVYGWFPERIYHYDPL